MAPKHIYNHYNYFSKNNTAKQGVEVGFNVDAINNLVTVDHTHNDYCVTTVPTNPVYMLQEDLKITSIFARTKGRRSSKTPGDNCPMLYALKRTGELRTNVKDVAKLRLNFRKILKTYLETDFQWDWIIPLPSSSNLCESFAEEVRIRSQIGIIQPNYFVKITAQEALDIVKGLNVSSKVRTTLSSKIRKFIKHNTPQTSFQIKYIDKKQRKLINPFNYNSMGRVIAPPREYF